MLSDLIDHSAIEDDGLLLFVPGVWADQRAEGRGVVLNPSYFAPASFRLFHEATGDPRWLRLADSSYDVLDATCRARSGSLPSDWIRWLAVGEWQAEPGARGTTGWDAVRLPWRIATDALWWREPRARAYLARCIEPHVVVEIDQGMAVEYDDAGRKRDSIDHPLANALYSFGLSRRTDRDRLLGRVEQQLTRVGGRVYFGEIDRYYVNSLAYLPFLARAGRLRP
jgi:endoglucanase